MQSFIVAVTLFGKVQYYPCNSGQEARKLIEEIVADGTDRQAIGVYILSSGHHIHKLSSLP